MPILKHAWTSSRIIWSTQKPKISKPQVEEHTSLRSSLRRNLDSSEYQLEVSGALQMLRAWGEQGEPSWDISDLFTSVNKRLFSLLVFQWFLRETSAIGSKICAGFNRPFTYTNFTMSFIYTHNKAHNIPKMKKKKKRFRQPTIPPPSLFTGCFLWVLDSNNITKFKHTAHSAYYASTISDSNGGQSWQKTTGISWCPSIKKTESVKMQSSDLTQKMKGEWLQSTPDDLVEV